MRDNFFLKSRLKYLWNRYFFDVPQENNVEIRFGRKARKRLGSIRRKNSQAETLISINGFFKSKKIPINIVDATIVHELCHYAHGFASPLPQLCQFPHKGGVVEKEIKNRGLENIFKKQELWLDKNWQK